jgi:hypothetical protein
MWAIAFAVLCAVPAVVFRAGAARLRRRTGAGGHAEPVPPHKDDRERYSKDLRRLAADHERVLVADVPAKAARLRALELAYDDTLVHACRALEVEAPPTPFDAITRVQVEADLVTRGLTW